MKELRDVMLPCLEVPRLGGAEPLSSFAVFSAWLSKSLPKSTPFRTNWSKELWIKEHIRLFWIYFNYQHKNTSKTNSPLGLNNTIFHNYNSINCVQILQLMGYQDSRFVPQVLGNAFFEHMLAYMSIYCTQRIIEDVNWSVRVNCSCQIDSVNFSNRLLQ